MPQRFLRPGIRTSEKWNAASFLAQSLYIGLLTLVDDFGRYDGRPRLIHGEVFALRDDVKPQESAAALQQLHNIGLVRLYSVEGKEYVQITNWQERTRSEVSKFPENPTNYEIPAESCAPLRNAAESCLPRPKPSSPSPSPSPSLDHRPKPSIEEKPVRAVFHPPSLEEVKLWAAKSGLPETEALKFHAYYESNGWRVGRNPMKSWHGAMATWKIKWEEQRNGSHQQNYPRSPQRITGADQRKVGIPAVNTGVNIGELLNRKADHEAAARNSVATKPPTA